MMPPSLIDMIRGKKWLIPANSLPANSSLSLNTFHSHNKLKGLRGGWVENETQNKYTIHVFEDLLDILEDKLELDLN